MADPVPRGIDDVLEHARRNLVRLSPHEAYAAQQAGATIIDTRPEANRVAGLIRRLLADSSAPAAPEIRILYGGSVKPDNIREFLEQPEIDGALVGGASLDARAFAAIVRAAAEAGR